MTLVKSAVTGDLNRVRTLIDDEGLDVNTTNRLGYTALMGAATAGHIKIVRFLKRRRANLDFQGPKGVTALMLAIDQGYERVFRFLIRSGASPHLSDEDGVTPLFLLSHKGYLRDVKFLVRHHNVDLDVQTKEDRFTALMAAVDNEDIRLVRFLVDSGANRDLKDKWGVTALMRAVAKGNKRLVSILVDAGADIMKRDENKFSALEYAIIGKDIEIITILLNGIKVNSDCLESLISETVH